MNEESDNSPQSQQNTPDVIQPQQQQPSPPPQTQPQPPVAQPPVSNPKTQLESQTPFQQQPVQNTAAPDPFVKKSNAKKYLIISILVLLVPAIILIGMTISNVLSDDSDGASVGGSESAVKVSSVDSKLALGNVALQINNYTVNNNGKLFTSEEFANGILDTYLDEEDLKGHSLVGVEPLNGEISYSSGFVCGPDGIPQPSDSQRQYTLYTLLDDGEYYCIDG